MLNAIREGSKKSFFLKIIVFTFLLLGLGGLVLMDVGGVFRGGLGNTTLARVGDTKMNIYEFQRDAERILRAQGMTMEDARRMGFIEMILQGKIMQELMDQSAQEMGLVINKSQVEETIGRMLDTYRQDGQSRKDVLETLLFNQNLSESTLIDQTKSQLKSALVKNMLSSVALHVPDVTAEALKMYQSERRDIEVFYLPASAITLEQEPSDENLRQTYEEVKERFLIPESRTISFINLSSDLFTSTVSITEDELETIYNERIEEYELPEQRFLEQAIVSDVDTATKILNKAENGTNLKRAVLSVTGDESAYRAETNFEREGLLDALADPVFNAENTGYLDLQQSALGWHVINLVRVEAPRTQEFSEVKDRIRKETLQEMTDDLLIDMLERAEDRISAGDTVQQIATTLDIDVNTVDDIDNDIETASQSLMMANIFDPESVMPVIFELDQNVTSDPIETMDDGFIILEVTNIVPQSYQSYEDVKDKVSDIWMQRTRSEELRKKASAITLYFNTAQNVTMTDIAAEQNLKLSVYSNVSKNDASSAGLNDEVINAAFATTTIDRASFVPANEDGEEGFYIFNTKDIYYPENALEDNMPLAVQKLQITKPLESAAQELFYLYLNDTENVAINDRLLEVVFGSPDRSQSM